MDVCFPQDDSSNHSASDVCMLPAYLRAPEVTAQVMAEYIWLAGGTGQLRSKTKVLDRKPSCPEEVPIVVVESNPGGQLAEPNFELFLKPRKLFRDPFRGGDHILVLCDTFGAAQVSAEPAAPSVLQPSDFNSRVACENVLKVAEAEEPVFSAEQEYAIIHPAYPTVVPMGPARRSSSHSSNSNGRHSGSHGGSTFRGGISKPCSRGATAAAAPRCSGEHTSNTMRSEAVASRHKAARSLADAHLRCCLFAGVKVTGADVHSLEGLHSYKVGPAGGVDLGDDLWTSRYLLQRVAEDHGTSVSWDPHALPQERPLACHFKYSTAATRRTPHGLSAIEQQLARLQATHLQHQIAYNDGRLDRLTRADASAFTHAIGSADVSISIPSLTYLQQGGYYTDRRPPSDADPYKVTLLLTATTLDVPLPKMPGSSAPAGLAPAPVAPAPIAAAVPALPLAVAAAGVPAGAAALQLHFSPMRSFLLAVTPHEHLGYNSDSEECDSVDEDSSATEDSAALLAKMDDDGKSSADSDFEQEEDDASGPVAHLERWDNGQNEMLVA